MNVHQVASAVEYHARAYGATFINCFWVPGTARVSAHYSLTMAVTSGEVWTTSVFTNGTAPVCSKRRGNCPVPYETIECTPLREMKSDARTPRGYMLRLVDTYANGVAN